MTIGYLNSAYNKVSHTFIRGEVVALRDLGFTVHTFSTDRPEPDELVSELARREHATTEYVLAVGVVRLAMAFVRAAFRAPRRLLQASWLALRIGTPGLKGRLWPLAYLLEAAYLADRLRAKGVTHLHNHFGEDSAAVAMLAGVISGIPYSLTIHGPGEFDRPTLLALDEKIRRATFVATTSSFNRAQLLRWSDSSHWPKIKLVRSGVEGVFLGARPTPVPGDRRLVCVGRLVEQKGQLLLIEALARLVAEGLESNWSWSAMAP